MGLLRHGVLFLLEVLQTVKGCTAQEPPAADDLVNIIIHNIHAGGICDLEPLQNVKSHPQNFAVLKI